MNSSWSNYRSPSFSGLTRFYILPASEVSGSTAFIFDLTSVLNRETTLTTMILVYFPRFVHIPGKSSSIRWTSVSGAIKLTVMVKTGQPPLSFGAVYLFLLIIWNIVPILQFLSGTGSQICLCFVESLNESVEKPPSIFKGEPPPQPHHAPRPRSPGGQHATCNSSWWALRDKWLRAHRAAMFVIKK